VTPQRVVADNADFREQCPLHFTAIHSEFDAPSYVSVSRASQMVGYIGDTDDAPSSVRCPGKFCPRGVARIEDVDRER